MNEAERRSAKNGIWMCKLHGRSIDLGDPKYTVELLQDWKRQAEQHSNQRVLYGEVSLPARALESHVSERLLAAAVADLEVIRRSEKWPATDIALTVEVEKLDKPISTSVLACMLSEIGDLVLLAPPGMGKTSTLLQVAQGLIERREVPIFVPLADWATQNKSLLESVLGRTTFRAEISEEDFRTAAQRPGVYFLLDGWNELDSISRRRATVEVMRLQSELPDIGLFVSTRKQSLDVPFEGTEVALQPLTEGQQVAIAKVLRGDNGERIVNEAWHTPGVSELVTIPLYLTALLALPAGEPFPQTKEELLSRFVRVHEDQNNHAEPLIEVIKSLHTEFLSALAVTATQTANTSLSETNARRSITETNNLLVRDGQLSIKLQTPDVLDTLISHHVLVRTRDSAGYSFQHQQFQEWYASKDVERLILASAGNEIARQRLKTEIFNKAQWEEPILFAVERLARGDELGQKACGVAIRAAFEVDPILAAEMIFRSTDAVWNDISEPIQDLVKRWHKAGTVDRAFKFMMASGRPEFRQRVWPLITDEDGQISLSALRVTHPFRPSILGPDAVRDILAMPLKVREVVVSEIAMESGMDGLDLATDIAKMDAASKVKVAVINAMSFRRADRHLVDVLIDADEQTFDLAYKLINLENIDNQSVFDSLESARARAQGERTDVDRLNSVLEARDGRDYGTEVGNLIATIDFGRNKDQVIGLIYRAQKFYDKAVAGGLLRRLQEGRELFYGADDILAASEIVSDDDAVAEMSLLPQDRLDNRAKSAASVLDEVGAGRLIDAMLAAKAQISQHGKYDKNLSDRYHGLRDQIGRIRGSSLVDAVKIRAETASNDDIQELAWLLCRQEDMSSRARPFSQEAQTLVISIAEMWTIRVINDREIATRHQLSAIARLIEHFPSVSLLPSLVSLLSNELRLWSDYRARAEAEQWRGEAADEARLSYEIVYQNAFLAIKAPETTKLMVGYLPDEMFGAAAARVLKVQWLEANEPKVKRYIRGSVDFSNVEKMRVSRSYDATLTSDEAEAIFSVVNALTSSSSTLMQRKRASRLAIEGARIPHGNKPELIATLCSITPLKERSELVLNLVLSGEIIPFDVVLTGINGVLKEAEQHPWVLFEGWQLKAWLRLLPFTDNPGKLVDVIHSLPLAQRQPQFLEELLWATTNAQTAEIEAALFELGDKDPSFYASRPWREALLTRGSLTAARGLLDLMLAGKLDPWDGSHTSMEIAKLLAKHPEIRRYVYDILKEGKPSHFELLARAVAECADHEGILLLVELEYKLNRRFVYWRTIEGVVTEHVPSEDWRGAFNIVPVDATALRKQLLAMTSDGGPGDYAAAALREIEQLRDERGAPEGEPRHPDLSSGKQWPILAFD